MYKCEQTPMSEVHKLMFSSTLKGPNNIPYNDLSMDYTIEWYKHYLLLTYTISSILKVSPYNVED